MRIRIRIRIRNTKYSFICRYSSQFLTQEITPFNINKIHDVGTKTIREHTHNLLTLTFNCILLLLYQDPWLKGKGGGTNLFTGSSLVNVAVKIANHTQTCATGTCLFRGSMKQSSNLILCGEKFVLDIQDWVQQSWTRNGSCCRRAGWSIQVVPNTKKNFNFVKCSRSWYIINLRCDVLLRVRLLL
jgi:hypothetical protein